MCCGAVVRGDSTNCDERIPFGGQTRADMAPVNSIDWAAPIVRGRNPGNHHMDSIWGRHQWREAVRRERAPLTKPSQAGTLIGQSMDQLENAGLELGSTLVDRNGTRRPGDPQFNRPRLAHRDCGPCQLARGDTTRMPARPHSSPMTIAMTSPDVWPSPH
jgi:hypothetical protein